MKKVALIVFLFSILAGTLMVYGLARAQEPNSKEPVLIDYPGFSYISMDFKGLYKTIGEKIGVFKEEFKKQGLKATGSLLAAYYNSPRENKKEDWEWALARPVSPDVEPKASLKKHEFKKTRCVVLYHDDYSKTIQGFNDKVKNLSMTTVSKWSGLASKYFIVNLTWLRSFTLW